MSEISSPLSSPSRPASGALRLSPSSLDRYRACPRSFYWADIERARRDEEPNPILCQANAIHAALDRFFGLPPEHRSPETLELALRSVWVEHRRRGAFAGRGDERRHGLEAIELLRTFYETFDTSAVPLSREQWVKARLDSGIVVFGKVDRIDRASGGGLELIDYKTGRRQLAPEDIAADSGALVYLVAAEATYGLEVERVRFLRSGDEVRWTPEREDVTSAAARLEALATAIAGEETFPAIPGAQCRFCPFALRCPDRQAVSLDSLAPVEELPF